jgi:response regulator RpfG family c-di-GMP phosphodiesterase
MHLPVPGVIIDRRAADVSRVPLVEQSVEVPNGSTQLHTASELVDVIQRLSLARTIPEVQAIVGTAARRLTCADGATLVYRELDEARGETLQRLALAAEYRDGATSAHTERVAQTSYLIAQHLGMSESEASLIAQAAPLHDIGKLSVSDAVLRKPGRLTAEECEKVKTHTSVGAAILSGSHSAVLQLAAEIALTHHEWWDGSGYPGGLSGDAIPLSGRIVALADVFDALTHIRPYKNAWSISRAVAKITALAGRQFDPAVVAAFRQLGLDELAGTPVPD